MTYWNMINVHEEGGHKCPMCVKTYLAKQIRKHFKNFHEEGDNLNCEC